MECRMETKKGSSDRPPFVAAEKKVLNKESSKSFTPDKFRDDKRGLSYSDFHREITKKVEDVCPKRLENRLKSRIGRTASGERDLVKYKSYVPSYIKKYEKHEEKVVKAGGIGLLDLRNRQSGDKQVDKHTRSSLSNTSTSSSLWTDESSTDSSRGLCASPFRKRVNHPPLQYYLMSSKPGDNFQDLDPPRDDGDMSESHSFLPGNITDRQRDTSIRDGQFHQSPRATALPPNDMKDSDFKIAPKTRTFLSPSKPDSPSCTRIISRNLAEDFKKKGEKMEERIRNPRVHDLFGKEKPAAVFVPGIVSQKQIIGLSKFYDSKVLLAERVAETKGFSEKLAYGKVAVLDSGREADGSKPFLKRISFLSSERSCSAPRSRKAESSPSRSRTLDRRSAETLPKQSDQKPAKIVSERARSISPFRRLSFSIGKSSKNSNTEDAQTPPHLSASLISSRAGLDNLSASSLSDSSSIDKTSAVNRGRSSPLRRLLDPLIKPKSSHSCRSPEPSQKDAPLSHQKHMLSDSQPSSSLLSSNGKTSTVQALFRVTSKNDQPLFTFAVEKEQSITAATIRKQTPPEKEDYGHKYTFFTVQEVQKKNGKWMNHGRKMQNQEYTSNIVAQMRVSGSKPLIFAGESAVDNLTTREFVLFASESQRTNELAAMVIKIPKISDTSSTKDTTLGDYFADVDATVVLPSGIHSLPHKGGPSSLIQRWKSGGSCDCGGWDIGCNLRILTNQHNKPRNPSPSTSDAFKLFFQGGSHDNNNQPFLSFTPYREGVYAVEYNTSLSLLQAFSICIAINEGRNPSKTTEPNNTSCVDNNKAYGGEMSSIQNERLKSFSGPIEAEAPARYLSHHPPLSPVGRV
ncbi:hypothetical protein CARUB_v10022623mg [Capsella rubella]|uniref:Uncharacterized protein n=1 Tax=Capsella rubella TaxID=81985 RepID=R0HMV9_9BRAS|nr:uncharacterized protein LOC17889682 [Capsella rubella]EOA26565.1 hypothetical protein CARUB_v10022623mg [Capsella rubella]EOA26566.1 hypothetical protein CARUB_v10022623mg [Capsella rubella]